MAFLSFYFEWQLKSDRKVVREMGALMFTRYILTSVINSLFCSFNCLWWSPPSLYCLKMTWGIHRKRCTHWDMSFVVHELQKKFPIMSHDSIFHESAEWPFKTGYDTVFTWWQWRTWGSHRDQRGGHRPWTLDGRVLRRHLGRGGLNVSGGRKGRGHSRPCQTPEERRTGEESVCDCVAVVTCKHLANIFPTLFKNSESMTCWWHSQSRYNHGNTNLRTGQRCCKLTEAEKENSPLIHLGPGLTSSVITSQALSTNQGAFYWFQLSMTGSLLRRRRKKDEEWGRIIKGNNDRGTSRRLVTSEAALVDRRERGEHIFHFPNTRSETVPGTGLWVQDQLNLLRVPDFLKLLNVLTIET